jgi:small redox-active disulfide protein 2
MVEQKSNTDGKEIMEIELLETGCATCSGLEDNVREALEKTGEKAEIIIINELSEIIKRGVMSTPAIIINGKVKLSGESVSVEKIMRLINEN